MQCRYCRGNQKEFASEVCIHFSGIDNHEEPHVFEFPKILVCLQCGLASFKVSESSLPLLGDTSPHSNRTPGATAARR